MWKSPKINKPSFKVLVSEAKRLGISSHGKTRDDLYLLLAGKSEKIKGVGVFDRDCSPDEKQRLEAKGHAVPGRTLYYMVQEEQLMRLWGEKPMAFNDFDLTNNKQELNFVFDDHEITCHCGEQITLAKFKKVLIREKNEFGKATGKVTEQITGSEAVDWDFCPNCGRKWTFIDTECYKE